MQTLEKAPTASLDKVKRDWLIAMNAALDIRQADVLSSKLNGSQGQSADNSHAGGNQAAQMFTQGDASADSAPGGGTGQGPVKISQEVEIATKSVEKKTKYGVLKLTATIKVAPTIVGGGTGNPSPVGSNTTGTSRIKDDKRQGGVKQGFAYQGIKNLEILNDLQITDILLGVEGEWSGAEISAYVNLKATIKTSFFTSPANAKLIVLSAKEGESAKFLGIEIKVSPVAFKAKVGGIETLLHTEYKGSFVLDRAKVGQEIIEKLAKDKLEKEAKKQGVKMLARTAGETILKRLGPIAAAFGVGWDIGTLLSKYTVAGEAALQVHEDILGNFRDEWHKADTLGRMFLVVKNKERIVASLIAAGVVGVAAGIGDIVLFKILKLDVNVAQFKNALKQFLRVMESIPNLGDAMGDMILSTAIKLGIKLNPKYRTISDPNFDKLALAVYALIKPVYKKKGGLNELISLRLHDVDIDEAVLTKIAELIRSKKLSFTDRLDATKPTQEIAVDFLDFGLQEFLTFMETHRLITYKIKISDELSTSSITESLINEVFL